jgi:excinuclease UvrABC helicase subunit UvrB
LEYASEVWDNCGVGNFNKLDQLQLEAARIVSGLPIFAGSIYKELSWESLTEKRKRRKLQMFYNIQNNNAPRYLFISHICIMGTIKEEVMRVFTIGPTTTRRI